MNENLLKMENFFKANLKVKKLLYDCAPKDIYNYNNESIMEYQEKLYNTIIDIKEEFISICNFFNYESDFINNLFEAYNRSLINCGSNYNKLKLFYQTCFSDMDEDIIKRTRQEYVGYSLFKDISLIKDCKSINEIMHVLHSAITNDEKNYSNIPKTKKKKNNRNYDISIYGNDNKIANDLFKKWPFDLISGEVDILALSQSNKVLIMVRDRGHAVSIEIDTSNDKCFINYFIPKVCNIDMINNLKGISKITYGDRFAIGCFESPIETTSEDIINLVGGIPMDEHMSIKGGISFNNINTR